MTTGFRLGEYVRFRAGTAPEALKGRESDVGVVVDFERRGGPEPWPVAQFDGYMSAVQPGLLEVAGYTLRDCGDPEMAN